MVEARLIFIFSYFPPFWAEEILGFVLNSPPFILSSSGWAKISGNSRHWPVIPCGNLLKDGRTSWGSGLKPEEASRTSQSWAWGPGSNTSGKRLIKEEEWVSHRGPLLAFALRFPFELPKRQLSWSSLVVWTSRQLQSLCPWKKLLWDAFMFHFNGLGDLACWPCSVGKQRSGFLTGTVSHDQLHILFQPQNNEQKDK